MHSLNEIWYPIHFLKVQAIFPCGIILMKNDKIDTHRTTSCSWSLESASCTINGRIVEVQWT